MPRKSAALLPFRFAAGTLEVFLVHPGGPYWAKKDDGAWSIAKGEYGDDEDPLAAAQREFTEETGFVADGTFIPLGTVKQKGGKLVTAWAFRGDFDATRARSNSFTMEWPPRSGKTEAFPEVDRSSWFSIHEASTKIIEGQRPLLEALVTATSRRSEHDDSA